MNQLTQVREHLLKHGSLTSWDAIQNWRLTRLSQYILLLRQEGYIIGSHWESNAERRWVRYILISVPSGTVSSMPMPVTKYEGNQMVIA